MRKALTVLLFITLVILLFVFQPSMMFNENGDLKNFNYEGSANSTLLPMILIVPILAILSFLIVLIIEMILT